MPRTPSRPAQIFEKHGAVEEVFIMRGGSRSGMACAFIRYAAQEMAQQAIDAIHGNITLPDATEPLVVRWADTPGSRGREARGGRHGAPGKRSPSLGGADRRGAGAGGSYGVGMGSMLMQPNAYAYTPAYVPVPAPVQARSAPSSRIALCCLDARGDDALHRAMLACGATCFHPRLLALRWEHTVKYTRRWAWADIIQVRLAHNPARRNPLRLRRLPSPGASRLRLWLRLCAAEPAAGITGGGRAAAAAGAASVCTASAGVRTANVTRPSDHAAATDDVAGRMEQQARASLACPTVYRVAVRMGSKDG
eukprot:scaffold12056_cov146-Isochrysis_galbana.AAC.2